MILCTGIGSTIVDAVKDLEPGEQFFPIKKRSAEVYDFTQAPPGTRIILAGGFLAGKSNEDHTRESIAQTQEANFIQPQSIAQQALAEIPGVRICIIGSLSATAGSYDQQYALAKLMIHRYVLRQKVADPQQLIVVAPPIIADSGMTRRRSDYPGVLKVRNHCYAADVARVIHRALWQRGPGAEGNNNTVIFVEPSVKVEGAAC